MKFVLMRLLENIISSELLDIVLFYFNRKVHNGGRSNMRRIGAEILKWQYLVEGTSKERRKQIVGQETGTETTVGIATMHVILRGRD